MAPIDEKTANEIYDILVSCRLATERSTNRQDFIHLQALKTPREYRLDGWGGAGSKFYNTSNRWYVGCYRESETEEIVEMQQVANGLLANLKVQIEGTVK